MFDLFDNIWGDKSEIILDHCLDITLPVGYRDCNIMFILVLTLLQVALFVIGVAGNLHYIPL